MHSTMALISALIASFKLPFCSKLIPVRSIFYCLSIWHLFELFFEMCGCNLVGVRTKMLLDHVGALFRSIKFQTNTGHVILKIL